MKKTVSHHDFMMRFLAKSEDAVAYLNHVAGGGEFKFLLKAIRNVVEAQGGIGVLAKKTKLSRTTLYKTLSENGNPSVSTLETILSVYGIQLRFMPVGDLPVRRGAAVAK